LRTQALLSAAIGATGHNLRSIRRGRLLHDASLGIGDGDLQLLPGHKRVDTLMRYLGWGRLSATARKAAVARAAAVPTGGGTPVATAPKMGLFSGRNGVKGRPAGLLGVS
ncbi:MAG: hypothetical protein Q8R01_18200, partial [Ramlibacter sp.]|nr:hypothetical protein [Ramlibacter sp.]